jgi:hypothetical protein
MALALEISQPAVSADPSSRRSDLLEALSSRGLMTADHLESRRVRLKGAEETFILGGVSQLEGPSACQRLVRFLSVHPEMRLLWVEQDSFAYPPGMAQLDPHILQRTLFCDARGDVEASQWAVLQGLRSSLFGGVVLRLADPLARKPSELQTRLRRLRLEAERAQACVWILARE